MLAVCRDLDGIARLLERALILEEVGSHYGLVLAESVVFPELAKDGMERVTPCLPPGIRQIAVDVVFDE